jgi:hypothetical protein
MGPKTTWLSPDYAGCPEPGREKPRGSLRRSFNPLGALSPNRSRAGDPTPLGVAVGFASHCCVIRENHRHWSHDLATADLSIDDDRPSRVCL